MQGGWRGSALLFFAVIILIGGVSGVGAIEFESPQQLFQALNALRVDPARVYRVHELRLRRDAISLTLTEGQLGFFQPLNGRVTGAVFTGQGRAISTPPLPAERRSLAQFLGVPVLDQGFTRAYLRFTDDTADELERQLRDRGLAPMQDQDFADRWSLTLANLNPEHSLRIMMDWLGSNSLPYFYGSLSGEETGPFDVLVDDRRGEQVALGQPRLVNGERFYDTWASFPRENAPVLKEAFAPIDYAIDTRISDDLSLEGKATLRIRAVRGGERMILVELSRFLEIEKATDSEGRDLVVFQNTGVNRNDVGRRGNDALLVALPEPSKTGQEIALDLTYHGRVISDAGNGVYFVGSRGSWYPHLGGLERFSTFDLTFTWPKRLTLVATGTKLDERETSETRTGHWRSPVPAELAGFNLGDYVRQAAGSGYPKIELLANKQLESAIVQRLQQRANVLDALPEPDNPLHRRLRMPALESSSPVIPPSPAAVLKQLGANIADSIRYLEKLNGAFPFDSIEVSQIPGSFGQGWPGLLYLSTFVFLPAETQQLAGLGKNVREEFSDVVPYHEVAHQWWGNVVGLGSYRDAWIEEAVSNYEALLYADGKKPSEHILANWLERYRAKLTTKKPGEDETPEEAGPLTLGYRLSSSRSPGAYDAVIYGKGTWVIHMLRMMLHDAAAKDPDARFEAVLHHLLAEYRFQPLSTSEFQRAFEQAMTPAMDLEGNRSLDWFFDEWVRGTGLPGYTVEFDTRPRGQHFLVRGTLEQNGVPEEFIAGVPLYAQQAGGKPVLLGTVVTAGPETTFQFVSSVRPRRILIDPRNTLLTRAESH